MTCKINVVDYLDMYPIGCDADYLYGGKTGVNARTLYRMDASQNFTAGCDASTAAYIDEGVTNLPNGSLWNMVFETSSGAILAQINDFTNGTWFLFKSIDQGVTFGNNAPDYNNGQAVSKIGYRGSTHTSNINILGTRGICEKDGIIYYGEYNTNGSRVAGSTNDHVRIMKSSDNGDTWSVALEWNTNGSTRQFTHCHFIKNDPYSDYIFIGMGDGANSAMIRWDGAASATNLTVSQLNSTTGFLAAGGSDYQTTDLLFKPDYIYNPTDIGNADSGATNRGIFRFNRNFEGYTRVSDHVLAHDYHAMYWGVVDSNGKLVATEILESGATDHVLYFYTSADGSEWAEAGRYMMETSASGRSPMGFLEWKGNIYCGNSNRGAGKDTHVSTVFRLGDAFTESAPDTIHPVYWVDPSGTDGAAPNGYKPSSPYATVKYAVESNRMTYGGRLILNPGLHKSASANCAWQANTNPAGTQLETVIEGTEGQTILVYDTDYSGAGFTLEASDGDIQFRKMRVINYNNNPLTTSSGYDGTLTENVVKGLQKWKD